jgi:hypothetical protein
MSKLQLLVELQKFQELSLNVKLFTSNPSHTHKKKPSKYVKTLMGFDPRNCPQKIQTIESKKNDIGIASLDRDLGLCQQI